jgi:hypothetical protein
MKVKVKLELQKHSKRLNEVSIRVSYDKTNFEMIGFIYSKLERSSRTKKLLKDIEERLNHYFMAQLFF